MYFVIGFVFIWFSSFLVVFIAFGSRLSVLVIVFLFRYSFILCLSVFLNSVWSWCASSVAFRVFIFLIVVVFLGSGWFSSLFSCVGVSFVSLDRFSMFICWVSWYVYVFLCRIWWVLVFSWVIIVWFSFMGRWFGPVMSVRMKYEAMSLAGVSL